MEQDLGDIRARARARALADLAAGRQRVKEAELEALSRAWRAKTPRERAIVNRRADRWFKGPA